MTCPPNTIQNASQAGEGEGRRRDNACHNPLHFISGEVPQAASLAPIGIFDSGFGGLTVLRELIDWLPRENFIFVGDSARCPYGPRPLSQVRTYALQICDFLVKAGCKIIVIACNTATAAGLSAAQMQFSVPIVGVVEPGARAAVHMTRNRRVGVIATQGTIDSGAYTAAIHNIDAGIKVFAKPTPGFVDIAERGIFTRVKNPSENQTETDSLTREGRDATPEGGNATPGSGDATPGSEDEYFARSANYTSPSTTPTASADGLPSPSPSQCGVYSASDIILAKEYLDEFAQLDIDTLVMGCTHFPLVQDLICANLPADVKVVSSAVETAADVYHILKRRDDLNPGGEPAYRRFFTSAADLEEFSAVGGVVLGGLEVDANYVSF